MRVAIGLRLEGNENWEEAATYVTEAERLGVDFAWSHESWGMDAATPLACAKAAKSANLDFVALLQRVDDAFENRLDDAFGFLAWKLGHAQDLFDQIGFGQRRLLCHRSCFSTRGGTAAYKYLEQGELEGHASPLAPLRIIKRSRR